MSQTPYDSTSHGPVSIPMDTYAGQTQRIMPPPKKWCTPRCTIVIIAMVLLTIIFLVVWIVFVGPVLFVIAVTPKISYPKFS